MIIAVTYEAGKVFQHFGHSEAFKLYEVNQHQIVGMEVVPTLGSGHGALAGFLKDHKVDALICGGIGGGAKKALSDANIIVYAGVNGDADMAVNALLTGELVYQTDVTCQHHDENHGNCGSHGCGSHSCGEH